MQAKKTKRDWNQLWRNREGERGKILDVKIVFALHSSCTITQGSCVYV